MLLGERHDNPDPHRLQALLGLHTPLPEDVARAVRAEMHASHPESSAPEKSPGKERVSSRRAAASL